MSYSLLGIEARAYVLTLVILAFFLVFLAAIAYLKLSKGKALNVVYSIITLLYLVDVAALMELNRYRREGYDFHLSILGRYLDALPVTHHIAFASVGILVAVVGMIRLFSKVQVKYKPYIIKHALENIPIGLAFFSEVGDLYLSNKMFLSVCHNLLQVGIDHGNEIWEEVLKLQGSNCCVNQGVEPAFELGNGEVWQFSKSRIELEGKVFTQIKISNITKWYRLTKDIDLMNEKLEAQKRRLKLWIEEAERNAKEQAILDTKIQFHDEFGQLLIQSKLALETETDEKQLHWLLSQWSQVAIKSSMPITDQIESLSVKQIENLAKSLSCKIKMQGKLPEYSEKRGIFLFAINEMLKNAVFHAKAKELSVICRRKEDWISLLVENTTRKRQVTVMEGGGLLAVREKVERLGGSMTVSGGDKVSLYIVMKD